MAQPDKDKIIKSMSVHLALASGLINSAKAAKALGVDKVTLDLDRKTALAFAKTNVEMLLKKQNREKFHD